MKLRDRLTAAVRAFRDAHTLRDALEMEKLERKLTGQTLERKEQECERLHHSVEELGFRLRLQERRTAALTAALRTFAPDLTAAEEMKQLYDSVQPSLDMEGYTLYHMAEQLTGIHLHEAFPYESALGVFENAGGRELLAYLTAYCFNAVEWEVIPGKTYEAAVLGEVDTAAPEYRQFERRLYRDTLERMGFGDVLPREEAVQMAAQEQQPIPPGPVAMSM